MSDVLTESVESIITKIRLVSDEGWGSREVDKQLRRRRQERWKERMKDEEKRAIIYRLGKRRETVSTRFSQCKKMSNSTW